MHIKLLRNRLLFCPPRRNVPHRYSVSVCDQSLTLDVAARSSFVNSTLPISAFISSSVSIVAWKCRHIHVVLLVLATCRALNPSCWISKLSIPPNGSTSPHLEAPASGLLLSCPRLCGPTPSTRSVSSCLTTQIPAETVVAWSTVLRQTSSIDTIHLLVARIHHDVLHTTQLWGVSHRTTVRVAHAILQAEHVMSCPEKCSPAPVVRHWGCLSSNCPTLT